MDINVPQIEIVIGASEWVIPQFVLPTLDILYYGACAYVAFLCWQTRRTARRWMKGNLHG